MSNNCQFKLLVLHNNNPNYIVIWLWLTFTLLMNNIQGDLQFRNCGDRVSWYVLQEASFYWTQYSVRQVKLFFNWLIDSSQAPPAILMKVQTMSNMKIKTENYPYPLCPSLFRMFRSTQLSCTAVAGTLQIYGGCKCLEGW